MFSDGSRNSFINVADKFTATVGDWHLADAVLKDARLSAMRALGCIPISADDTDAFDRLMEWSLAEGIDDTLALVRLGTDLTPGLVAIILARYAHQWDAGGAVAFDNFKAVFRSAIEHTGSDIAVSVTEALAALAKVDGTGLHGAADAVAAFGRIADLLEAAGHSQDALASALTATNLIAGTDRALIEGPVTRALMLARKLGARDAGGVCLARKAAAYLNVDSAGSISLEAFSLLEELVRAPPLEPETRKMAMRIIGPAIKKVSHRLRTLVTFALVRDDLGSPLPPEGLHLLSLLATEWNLDQEELPPTMRTIWDLITDIEEERMALLPPVADDQAEADWIDFSFVHPVLQRSLPFSQSFRKGGNYQENLLAIHHELTHIECLSSHIGNTLLSIRAALFRNRNRPLGTARLSREGDDLAGHVRPCAGAIAWRHR